METVIVRHHQKNHSIVTTDCFLCTRVQKTKTPQHNLICSLYESPSSHVCLWMGYFDFVHYYKAWLVIFELKVFSPPLVGWHIGLTLYHCAGKTTVSQTRDGK